MHYGLVRSKKQIHERRSDGACLLHVSSASGLVLAAFRYSNLAPNRFSGRWKREFIRYSVRNFMKQLAGACRSSKCRNAASSPRCRIEIGAELNNAHNKAAAKYSARCPLSVLSNPLPTAMPSFRPLVFSLIAVCSVLAPALVSAGELKVDINRTTRNQVTQTEPGYTMWSQVIPAGTGTETTGTAAATQTFTTTTGETLVISFSQTALSASRGGAGILSNWFQVGAQGTAKLNASSPRPRMKPSSS